MAKEDKYGITSFKKDFPDDEACLDVIFDTLHSRKCSCGGTYSLLAKRRQFQCSKCRFQIAPTAGTIFHKSDTPLTLWFRAILSFSNAKSGISAKQLERDLEVTYKCAWRILSQIRKALKQSETPLRGVVEIDSGYFGGRKSGGRNNEKLGEAVKAKSVVTVAMLRYGHMRAEVRDNVTASSLEEFITKNVKLGSLLMTDNAHGYQRMNDRYQLETVNHSKREFARGGTHINNVETWFSHIKRSITGTFKAVSKEHLQSYLDAFVFHYNNRHNDRERFSVLLDTVLHA